MNRSLFAELTAGKTGERVNLDRAYKWIIEEMDYENFYRLAHLNFYDFDSNHSFDYEYAIPKTADSPKRREEFLEYLMYKLFQNLETYGVRLRG